MNNASNVKVTRTSITVDSIAPDQFKPELLSVQVRQDVTSEYPTVVPKTGGLFDIADYNLPGGASFTSTRVAWFHAPVGFTIEQIEALIAAKPNAVIYRLISNNVMDVLTDAQKSAMERGVDGCTVADFQDRLLVRAKDGSELATKQYSQNFFSAVHVEDGDNRTIKSEKDLEAAGVVGNNNAFDVVEKGIAVPTV